MAGLTEKANPQKCYQQVWTGVDVGSTTVKMIVVDNETDEILWQDYQRHDIKQPEKALDESSMMSSPVWKSRIRSTLALP